MEWFREYFGLDYILGDNSGSISKGIDGEYVRISFLGGGLIERTEREVNAVLEIIDIEPPSRILDCPCGYGRHI
ncbi:MAG TPA: hypothetical protein ENG00_01030 [Candidatus Aenigmarchaeota archaeon]|nr:hypothetical protein [Candidatus Aenigmarchaeota archaeon]